jgi:hypothetical protein
MLTDQFCTCAIKFMISTVFRDYNFNLFDYLTVFHISVFDVRFPEDDLKMTTTCHSVSGLCVKVCTGRFRFVPGIHS